MPASWLRAIKPLEKIIPLVYNIDMGKKRLGFTILETVLFLAISTLLLMSITWGITRRIADGRYNSTVDEFANIIRNVYASALNVENARLENEGSRDYCTISGAVATPEKGNQLAIRGDSEYPDYPGRTGCAIYGKLIIFGNANGPISNGRQSGDNTIYTFDLVGDAVDQQAIKYGALKDSKTIIEELKAIHLDYLALVPDDSSSSSFCKIKSAGSLSKSYVPWEANVYSSNNNSHGLTSSDDFVGMLMIVRSPVSGEVSTLIYQASLDDRTDLRYVYGATDDNSAVTSYSCTSYATASSDLHSYNLRLDDYMDDFKSEESGFCIATNQFPLNNMRRYVGVSKNGQNQSAVFIDASEDNPCY